MCVCVCILVYSCIIRTYLYCSLLIMAEIRPAPFCVVSRKTEYMHIALIYIKIRILLYLIVNLIVKS